VPGPATLGGTARSGVAVTTTDLRADAAFVGQIAAHEAAHFLGLFHTTEQTPDGGHDTIADTAECPADAAGDDGEFSADECPDGDNLLFWAPSADAFTLTGGQAYVLRHNLLVRP
jgi:hypothetical protein